eukprot:6918001-Alexandrium_andersonii.AAC.1
MTSTVLGVWCVRCQWHRGAAQKHFYERGGFAPLGTVVLGTSLAASASCGPRVGDQVPCSG